MDCLNYVLRSPGRPISRILCAQVSLRRWSSIWGGRLRQPRAANPGASDEQPAPCLALLRTGVTWPQRLPAAPVSFYLTFSPSPPHPLPLLSERGWGEGWHCVSVARSVRLPLPGSYPAPCSVECGLSSSIQRMPATIRPAWGISSYHKKTLPRNGGGLGLEELIRSVTARRSGTGRTQCASASWSRR